MIWDDYAFYIAAFQRKLESVGWARPLNQRLWQFGAKKCEIVIKLSWFVIMYEFMDVTNTEEISKDRLSELISHLRPDRELYSGRKFFETLLAYAGKEGVVAFIEKASKALSDKGELDLYFDFSDVEREAFNKARINYMSRRGFLGVFAVGGAGAVFGATGVTGLARQAKEAIRPREKSSDASSEHPVDTAEHFVKQFYPTAEVLIGGALLNEAWDKRLEIKLEQIADAVAELDVKLKKEAEKANTRISAAR